MGKIIPKTDPESKAFWESVEQTAREVAAWPCWRKCMFRCYNPGSPTCRLNTLASWLAEQQNQGD